MANTAMKEKVSVLRDSKVQDMRDPKVQDVYKTFLKEHDRNSDRTSHEYHSRINEFFEIMLGKDVRYVTQEDINTIKNKDVKEKFVESLLNRGNGNNTIITKLNSVRSFYNELLQNDIQVNPTVLSTRLKKEVKHHEYLNEGELLSILEFMKMEKDGMEKYLLTKMMAHTASRKTGTLSLKWDNIKKRSDINTGQAVWVVEYKGKGDKLLKAPISDEFYEELLQIKGDSENIFPELSKQGAYKRYERSLKKFGKVIGKNISFHSMKATGITLAYRMTKDMNLCKQLGGHESVSTTEIYIRDEESFTKQGSYLLSKKSDSSSFDSMSGDELKEFINRNPDLKQAIVMRLGSDA